MRTIFASALLCCSLAAYAEPEKVQIDAKPADLDVLDIMLAAGMTLGGDDLRTTADGDVSVTSGGLIYLAGGGVFHASQYFDVQFSFGYHFDEVTAENGTASFERTFIELLPFYVTEGGNRFGVGFTQVMSPKYSDPLDPMRNVTFDDASGMIVEYDWLISTSSSGLTRSAYVGVRYVNLTYDIAGTPVDFDGDGIDSSSVDGSYIGLLIQGNFW